MTLEMKPWDSTLPKTATIRFDFNVCEYGGWWRVESKSGRPLHGDDGEVAWFKTCDDALAWVGSHGGTITVDP